MTTFKGFFSYVHADDQAETGRITRLARDVVDQFQMLTGEEISLFLDKDALEWGENWREAIDSNLASVAFFIPVMSPRYFMSPECRRELQTFARRASDLGMKELILPLHYVDVPEIHNEETTDDLIALVCTFQWEDWRDLRFAETISEGYRRGVARLATRLVEANKHVEETNVVIVPQLAQENIDEMPGSIDKLANAEEMLQALPETTEAMNQEVILIGQIMREGTADIQRANSQGQGFSARLIVARRMAAKLSEPTEHIWSLSNKYASQIHDVDEGFRMIIERAPIEAADDPDSKAKFCTFFESVRNMASATREALQSIQVMLQSMEPLDKMSRDMRPVLRRLRQGLTIQIESMAVSDEWVKLIESSGIICEDANAQTEQNLE